MSTVHYATKKKSYFGASGWQKHPNSGKSKAPRKKGAKRRGPTRLKCRSIDPQKTKAKLLAWMIYMKQKENRHAQLKAIENKEVFTFDEDKFDPLKDFIWVGHGRNRHKSTLPQLMAGAPQMNLTDPGTIYEFVVSTEHNYTSSAGGIVNVALDFDPSSSVEWSSLITLFSLVRIKKASIQMERAVATAIPTTLSQGAFRPIIFALLRDNAGTPGSYAAIEDSPHTIYNYAFETKGVTRSISFPGPSGEMPLWADTSVPASSTTYVGCPGCCQMYGESIPVSTEVLFVVRSLTIQFQNRI